ncbi:alpha/beta fold hydrolase [Flaviramulus aquimarinus]|uniref:Alpha/beta fold hydrolase n=1 Tax=Flaviramulus aquimarinus TaxID=1170456 RepID=A0ABP9EVG8_9FLAO
MSEYLPKIAGSTINFISHFSIQSATKLAVKLFSTPKREKPSQEEVSYLNTSIQEDVTYKDFSLKTYHWSGKKDTILLAHGWESNAYRWKDLINQLQALDYNVIALDAPAHGNSGSKVFNALLYSECLHVIIKKNQANIIIGHSIGGTSCAISTKKYNLPSVNKLILLGAPSSLVRLLDNYIDMMSYNKKVFEAVNQYYLNRYNHLSEYFATENLFKNIPLQGLIIHDKKDRIISYRDALEISKYYKDAKLIKTIGLGHGLKSDKVYQYILDFINV